MKKPTPRKLARLREKRDWALIDAEIAERAGRSGDTDRRKALMAAIKIDKVKGYY